MGIAAPPAPGASTLGRLAVDFDGREYAGSGRLGITGVVPLGPTALAGIKAGDVLMAVDSRPLSRTTNLDAMLDHTIGKRTVLSVSSGNSSRDVEVKPVDQTTERGLRYRQWVEQKREYVTKTSGGRLGYVHMYDMSAAALEQLRLDLDVENHAREGVVIDVRNNNGGFVNVYAIDVFSRRGYFNMELDARGKGKAPDLQKELSANILPGVSIVPAMVIAIEKAQEAGIRYNRQ